MYHYKNIILLLFLFLTACGMVGMDLKKGIKHIEDNQDNIFNYVLYKNRVKAGYIGDQHSVWEGHLKQVLDKEIVDNKAPENLIIYLKKQGSNCQKVPNLMWHCQYIQTWTEYIVESVIGFKVKETPIHQAVIFNMYLTLEGNKLIDVNAENIRSKNKP